MHTVRGALFKGLGQFFPTVELLCQSSPIADVLIQFGKTFHEDKTTFVPVLTYYVRQKYNSKWVGTLSVSNTLKGGERDFPPNERKEKKQSEQDEQDTKVVSKGCQRAFNVGV